MRKSPTFGSAGVCGGPASDSMATAVGVELRRIARAVEVVAFARSVKRCGARLFVWRSSGEESRLSIAFLPSTRFRDSALCARARDECCSSASVARLSSQRCAARPLVLHPSWGLSRDHLVLRLAADGVAARSASLPTFRTGRVHGISTSQPRWRRDPSPRNVRVEPRSLVTSRVDADDVAAGVCPSKRGRASKK